MTLLQGDLSIWLSLHQPLYTGKALPEVSQFSHPIGNICPYKIKIIQLIYRFFSLANPSWLLTK